MPSIQNKYDACELFEVPVGLAKKLNVFDNLKYKDVKDLDDDEFVEIKFGHYNVEGEAMCYNNVRFMVHYETKTSKFNSWTHKRYNTSSEFAYYICELDDYLPEEEEEHEWEYSNYGTEPNPLFGSVSYQVAGGGLGNGNAYATIELKDGFYWYCEYGKDAYKKKVGTKIVWSDEIYDKKNPYECRSFDVY